MFSGHISAKDKWMLPCLLHKFHIWRRTYSTWKMISANNVAFKEIYAVTLNFLHGKSYTSNFVITFMTYNRYLHLGHLSCNYNIYDTLMEKYWFNQKPYLLPTIWNIGKCPCLFLFIFACNLFPSINWYLYCWFFSKP